MKEKRIFCILCVSLLLFSMVSCTGNKKIQPNDEEIQYMYEQTLKEAEDIKMNSNLGFEYMSFSEIPEDEAREWFGIDHPEAKTTDDGYVTGYYFNYPYDSADRRLTQIYIEGGDYDFYSIKLGDDISKVKPIMNEKGYSQTDNLYVFDGTATETYIKHHVRVVFETTKESSAIAAILVTVYEPNRPEEIN